MVPGREGGGSIPSLRQWRSPYSTAMTSWAEKKIRAVAHEVIAVNVYADRGVSRLWADPRIPGHAVLGDKYPRPFAHGAGRYAAAIQGQ